MKVFAIFGNPVSHSKSPLMHNITFAALGYGACYGRYLLENGEELREKFLSLSLSGANITVPHKEYAYSACDILDDFARKVGAVNTIVYKEGSLYGYNTDAPGFLEVIKKIERGRKILFLGAGGTAQSTAVILREEGYDVTILNRSSGRLAFFEKEGFPCFTYENFEGGDFDIVVNMTSAGLKDDSLPAPEGLLEKVLEGAEAAVDVIYGKKTPFLSFAEERGKMTKDGSDMLLYQGILAFDIFTEGKYAHDEIEKYMKRAFEI